MSLPASLRIWFECVKCSLGLCTVFVCMGTRAFATHNNCGPAQCTDTHRKLIAARATERGAIKLQINMYGIRYRAYTIHSKTKRPKSPIEISECYLCTLWMAWCVQNVWMETAITSIRKVRRKFVSPIDRKWISSFSFSSMTRYRIREKNMATWKISGYSLFLFILLYFHHYLFYQTGFKNRKWHNIFATAVAGGYGAAIHADNRPNRHHMTHTRTQNGVSNMKKNSWTNWNTCTWHTSLLGGHFDEIT